MSVTLRLTDHNSGFDQTIEIGNAANDTVSLGTIEFGASELKPTPTLEWSDTLCKGERVNHAAAEKACKALGDGWRLPTRVELLSLVDDTRSDPAIDTERFPDTKSGAYWTSTLLASVSSFAWFVDFNGGLAGYYDRDYYGAYVRAVRVSSAGQ